MIFVYPRARRSPVMINGGVGIEEKDSPVLLCLVVCFLTLGVRGKGSIQKAGDHHLVAQLWRPDAKCHGRVGRRVQQYRRAAKRYYRKYYSISATKDMQEKLFMIAAGDPGAPEFDIVTAYPKPPSSCVNRVVGPFGRAIHRQGTRCLSAPIHQRRPSFRW